MRKRRRQSPLAQIVLGALCALPLLACTPADALTAAPARLETPIRSSAPHASEVTESYVSLYDPLPAEDGPRPAA